MNLNANPTREQLRELLEQCDDTAGHHVVWVKRNGDVVISTIRHSYVDIAKIRDEPTVIGFQQDHPEMQLRCETFLAGNEYVGPEAAANDEWVSEFFDALLNAWQNKKGMPEVAYIPISDGLRST